MKGFWIFRIAFIASSLIFAPVSLPCHGQGPGGYTMSVNVPFAFDMGDKHFAPGTYRVSEPQWGVLELSGNSTAGLALIREDHTSKPTPTAKVVFHRYGDHYFLRQIWFSANDNAYLECSEPKSEKQAKQELASNSKKPSNVELAMLRLP